MDKARQLLVIIIGCVIFGGGCAERDKFKGVEEICAADLQKKEAMQKAEDVLGEMHFTVDKLDAEGGYIKTRPLQGAQFFEFWRSDNAGGYNWAEANLHTIRRTVEVNISEKGKEICIGCNAKTERLSMAGSEVASGSQAYGMYSASRPALQRLELRDEQKKNMSWVDLGRDGRLETEILSRIRNRLGKP
jgi:hypothetical protein